MTSEALDGQLQSYYYYSLLIRDSLVNILVYARLSDNVSRNCNKDRGSYFVIIIIIIIFNMTSVKTQMKLQYRPKM